MTGAAPLGGRRRLAALDGLRGAAIVLVVLSHGWALWPTKGIEASPVVGLFRAGNLAVTIFFVVGGFLLTRSLLGQVDRSGTVAARTAVLRRYARISAHVYPLVVAILVVHALDDTDIYDRSSLRQSVVRILTYTWNWFLRDSPLLARPDVGHLWYVCVYLQVTVLLVILVKLLGRHRAILVALLAVATVAIALWRGWVVGHESLYSALLRTTTRMDGMVWGALLAAVLPRFRDRVARVAPGLIPLSLVGLLALALTTGHDESYFGWAGVAMNVAVVCFVAAAVTATRPTVVQRGLEVRPLVWLGNASMAIFVWHYPIFWAVTRHTATWSWFTRTIVALALTAVFVLLAQRFVERPLQAWLAHPRWDSTSPAADDTQDASTNPAPADSRTESPAEFPADSRTESPAQSRAESLTGSPAAAGGAQDQAEPAAAGPHD
ncbi:hypothetical protein N865_00630 [Intrasporangium oryzae NRRL B-24470]|uniref:Acyltransferase 3 domain-containing protein n=1 Tax=Intrasporangium oryzae NRRL B-24470 TaxID=1386089 RepID=W9GGI7_9MICO|nr:acyltransferase [Intrasporangium oryzae]EWT02979.1 hypothetical protein N865_00630 [Intrasporangium oryzae NRRL B-24470]